ncbi:Phosphate import ATP-binding protein PstB 1 [Hyella patelloides LEGE 07179]|uniref:Phosphate import ATP-binding protein PstB 1 n=1 Tax=Hyella patelloides LEGE 07179 TaxID=945734 RepID=A0A563W574_9CYAN|nr:phosphate ABC transporter ATP-binding protein [Hyella patelloides]VEP18852.1 Phosphate import ATP-binding protein PstB 1 [Hyella patelloides LEGE 07179]
MTKSIHNNLDRHKIAEIQPLMQIHQLSLFYNQKPAFKDVTLSIPQNSITAIVGASGCGKSSFLICLNRLSDLIPGCTVSGHIQLGTLNILSPKANTTALRRRIGTIFQKPNPFPMSIKKNITFPLKEHGVKDSQQRHNIVEQVLKDVGLWSEVKDRLQDNALTLSGGQKQRLCIARTLALQPEILLMDEPCSALDPISSGIVEDLILRLRQKYNYTIIIVTHNLAQAKRIADYTALFWVDKGCGRLIEFAPAEQFFNAPNNELTKAYVNGIKG